MTSKMPEAWRRKAVDAAWKVVLNFEEGRVVVFQMERDSAGLRKPSLSAAKLFDKDTDVVTMANIVNALRSTIGDRAEFSQALYEQLGGNVDIVVEREML